jgi:MFS transporter, FSR family, fosmidomycin resistance protein
MAELPRGYRANRLAVLTGTHFVNDFYQGATSAIIALLALSNGYSYMAVTGLLLAVTASSSVVQPLLGFLADRFQTRWMMPAGIVTCGLGTGLLGIADGYWPTCAAAVVAGLGIAAYHPEAARAVRDTGGESATAMSWFALGGNVGFTLGPLAASPFLVWRGLDASPWLALPAFVTAVAGIWALRAHTAVRQQDRIRPAKQTGRDGWKAFGWLTISISARSAVIVGVASFVPLLFVRQFHVTPLIGSGALGLFFAAGLVGTLAGGRLADRRGATFPLWLGYTATGLGLLALALASDVWIAWAAVLVLGVGSYLPFGVNVTLGQRYLSNRTATASGVTLGLAVSVGGFVAPVFGMIADRAGLTTTLLAMVLMPVIAFVATTRLPATTKSAG